jgi:hypothetical protein
MQRDIKNYYQLDAPIDVTDLLYDIKVMANRITHQKSKFMDLITPECSISKINTLHFSLLPHTPLDDHRKNQYQTKLEEAIQYFVPPQYSPTKKEMHPQAYIPEVTRVLKSKKAFLEYIIYVVKEAKEHTSLISSDFKKKARNELRQIISQAFDINKGTSTRHKIAQIVPSGDLNDLLKSLQKLHEEQKTKIDALTQHSQHTQTS